jgi:hypothetical protein
LADPAGDIVDDVQEQIAPSRGVLVVPVEQAVPAVSSMPG